ncbi:MAG: glycosyl hydrolase, partial [Phycisphaerales bacterium]
MKKCLAVLFSMLLLNVASAAKRPWQVLSNPRVAEVASNFQEPPPEYAATITWGWDGPITEEVIVRDLDLIYSRGFRAVTIEAGYDMDNAPYLSDGWFKLVQFAVEQAKARGMRVWIIDEGKYPSGFAGGKFTQERPELRMQGLSVARRITVTGGESVSREVTPDTVGVIAVSLKDGSSKALDFSSGKFNWTAPKGEWRVLMIDRQFRTPQTRAVNDSTRSKTTKNSMGDLINPAAVQQFIDWTHVQYKKHIGDEFGKTVMGFRGDEPDFAYTPWTTGMLEIFKERKGYDVKPYLTYCVPMGRRGPRLVLTDEQRRAKADYWDVWSNLFGKHFFGMQAKWCADNGVEHMTHLNNEHAMQRLVHSSGDYFRSLRPVQIPGVDSIWNQVWPGKNADFVRLPASVAHVYGKARVLSESYAAYRDPPVTADAAEWGVNYQIVRGINLFEFMFYPSSAGKDKVIMLGYMAEEKFPGVMAYTNRACYVMSQGKPAAQIAVYFPSMSYWLGDFEADESLMNIARQLLEKQRDFDFVDDESLASTMKLKDGMFTNSSDQDYRAVIIPSVSAISKAALGRLKVFADSGGCVISIGREPSMVVEKTFLTAGGSADLSWAVREPSGEVTERVLKALPKPDVMLIEPCPVVKYIHKRWRDANLY